MMMKIFITVKNLKIVGLKNRNTNHKIKKED